MKASEEKRGWRVRQKKDGEFRIQRFLPDLGYLYPTHWFDLDGWKQERNMQFDSRADATRWAIRNLGDTA